MTNFCNWHVEYKLQTTIFASNFISRDDLDNVGEKKPETLIYQSWLIILLRCNLVWLFSIKEFTVTANDQFPCAIDFWTWTSSFASARSLQSIYCPKNYETCERRSQIGFDWTYHWSGRRGERERESQAQDLHLISSPTKAHSPTLLEFLYLIFFILVY